MNCRRILEKLILKQDLNPMEAEWLFNEVLHDRLTTAQTAACLTALAAKGESVTEVSQAVSLLKHYAVKCRAPVGALDVCGTGGDGLHTLNISTAVALVTAACGVVVAKHGNKAISSQSGSADVLEKLGVNVQAPVAVIERCLAEAGIGFLFAPLYHQSLKQVAGVRRELGVRTVFNVLGPLLNPAQTRFHLIGVYHARWLEILAEVLKNQGCQRAWIVHGRDGLDEISTTGDTFVAELDNGKTSTFLVNPRQAGLALATLDALKGGDATYNAQALMTLLQGEKGAYRDIVLINSAAALYVAGKAENLTDGVELAASRLDNGAALGTLERLVAISHG